METVSLRCTHTYVELELSDAAFDEIEGKLRDAGYTHAIETDEHGKPKGLMMQGIKLTRIHAPDPANTALNKALDLAHAEDRFSARDSLMSLGVDSTQIADRKVPEQAELPSDAFPVEWDK